MSRILNTYAQNATARDMAVYFKLKGVSQFPPDGIEESILIQGHHVWVDPKHPTKRMSIRTMTRCTDCGKILPVGRLGQHDRRMHQGITPKNQNQP
jgi:hypothetical protein